MYSQSLNHRRIVEVEIGYKTGESFLKRSIRESCAFLDASFLYLLFLS